jgi:hypothetical protein
VSGAGGPDEVPEVDLGDYLGLAPRDRAALAPNWRSPLRVDLGLGIVVLLAGLWLLGAGVGLGALAVVAGGAYATLVVRRWRHWAAIRRQAGLD